MKNGMEQLPGMSDRELYEAMTPEQIVDRILADGELVTDTEHRMSMASDVLSGYGLTVEEVLKERERNGENQAISP